MVFYEEFLLPRSHHVGARNTSLKGERGKNGQREVMDELCFCPPTWSPDRERLVSKHLHYEMCSIIKVSSGSCGTSEKETCLNE